MLEPGVRVVRGPNWSWENQDGGEGYLGTVSQIGTSESDKTVVVQWDNGNRIICRAGYLDKYDLRVIDNAQIGVSHHRFSCDGCNIRNICGMRYKCTYCYDYDLCYVCYHGGKHDLTHSFKRFETSKSQGVVLPPRLNARKCELKGIFGGATVIRGFDWEWANQDGGEGKCGLVLDIRGWGRKSYRSTAFVRWFAANTEIYRIGHKGCCDIQFVEAASGGYFYPEHLPVLGQSEEQMEFTQIIEAIELQQVIELERGEKNSPKVEDIIVEANVVEEPEETELTNPASVHLGPIASAYATEIVRYKLATSLQQNLYLIDVFSGLTDQFEDKTVEEMWEILKYMTELPQCNIIEERQSCEFIKKSVELGINYLENRFRAFMREVMNESTVENASNMHPVTYLVDKFVGLRLQGEYLGLVNETLGGRPLWPMIYYCLRAGHVGGAITCLEEVHLPELEDISYLLKSKIINLPDPEADIRRENMKYEYRTVVRNSTDPFKRIVWAVLVGIDEISEAARTVDDYLWFKLNQAYIGQRPDKTKYEDLQYAILEKIESHYDSHRQPLVNFKLLALTRQFEAAVDFLYRTDTFKVHAVHMAIALHELKMLACVEDSTSPLLSVNPADCKPSQRLNFALLINSYVGNFDVDCLNESLHYLSLLRGYKTSEGQDLFEVSVGVLVIGTKEYKKILGQVQRDGTRSPGLLDQFTNAGTFTENLGQSLIGKDLWEEAFELYNSVNLHDGVLMVMCKMLAKVAHLENQPGSLRNKMQDRAMIFDELFSKDWCNTDPNIRNSFIKLRGLLSFFDLYRDRQYPEALKTLNDLKIVPLRLEEVEERLRNFKNFVDDLGKVIPYVLLATMTILGVQCDKIKCTDGPMDQHLQCVWEQANCITNFAERLSNVITEDTTSRLFQMEILMH